jgi:hypothetical protein
MGELGGMLIFLLLSYFFSSTIQNKNKLKAIKTKNNFA